MLMPGGLLADTIGKVIGIGPGSFSLFLFLIGEGRGVAFLFVLLGLANSCASLLGLTFSPLRRVDIDLPDAH